MHHIRNVAGVATVGLLLTGCAGAPATVQNNEDLLAAAGFSVKAGDTSAYAAAVKQLPAHKFVHHVEQNVLTYYYFDPTICGCLYYGSQQAWDTYKQEAADKLHMDAEAQEMRDDTPFTGQGGGADY